MKPEDLERIAREIAEEEERAIVRILRAEIERLEAAIDDTRRKLMIFQALAAFLFLWALLLVIFCRAHS